MWLSLVLSLCTAADAGKSDRELLVQDARQVIAAIVEAGRQNYRRKVPLKKDELTAEYVRVAASAAGKLPEKRSGPAFALALGVALDSSSLMRKNPVVASVWKAVESDDERKKRLAVLGEPTMHARHDLTQHFVVSMALTAVLGEKKAEAAGIVKELLDANEGGSGFSFADLAADLAGIALTTWVGERPARLAQIEKGFQVTDYVPTPRGLVEGLSLAEFQKRYGGARDARFLKVRNDLVKKIAALPGYKEKR
jgi:hypothetical protein